MSAVTYRHRVTIEQFVHAVGEDLVLSGHERDRSGDQYYENGGGRERRDASADASAHGTFFAAGEVVDTCSSVRRCPAPRSVSMVTELARSASLRLSRPTYTSTMLGSPSKSSVQTLR